jgi:hypothetical protein
MIHLNERKKIEIILSEIYKSALQHRVKERRSVLFDENLRLNFL